MDTASNSSDCIQDVIIKIRSFQRTFSRRFGLLNIRADKRVPYSIIPLRIVYEISSKPGCTTVHLADFLMLDRSVVSRTVKKLVREGLVSRTVSEDDARYYFLYLTDEGQKYLETAVDFTENMVRNNITNHLSSEDSVRLAYHLEQADIILRSINDGKNS